MSFTTLATTSTVNTSTAKIKRQDSYSGSILLTPTKKRKIDDKPGNGANVASSSHPASSPEIQLIPKPGNIALRQGATSASRKEGPTQIIDLTETAPIYNHADVFNWTFTPESVASCWVKDVMEMKPSDTHDFWWIGKFSRVPCRMVRICGMVVGVKVDEKQIRYTVDDGTAVIECIHSIPRKPPARKVDNITDASMFFSDLPTPVAYVGHSVDVIGKATKHYESRVVKITRDSGSVERCTYNDEPKHWTTVRQLHESHYDLATPFEVPKFTKPPPRTAGPSFGSSSSPAKFAVPQTPSTTLRGETLETPSTVAGTPSTVHLSPEKANTHQSPQKLRHPSKLSSRNLTVNTFRIYVKHYMDYAPQPTATIDLTGDDTEDEDPGAPATPTRRSSRSLFLAQQTPRPGAYTQSVDDGQTPRPRIQALSFSGDPPGSLTANAPLMDAASKTQEQMGFTLSYLRRVPVLAELARRVVRAEEKRRAKAEHGERKTSRESQRTSASTSSSKPISSRSASSRTTYRDDGMTGKRMKRLFQQVVVDMMKEGSIVIWDGPARPIPASGTTGPNDSRMWKADASTLSTATADNSIFSVASSASQAVEEDVSMSDPEDNEECYLPLTPSFLSTYVESCIKAILKREEPMRRQGKLTAGATKETILARLRRDDRWRFLGEWHVEEALGWLAQEGRAWCVDLRGGKWELAE